MYMNLSAHEASGVGVRRGRGKESESKCSSKRSENGKHEWRYFGANPALSLKARKQCIHCNEPGDYND